VIVFGDVVGQNSEGVFRWVCTTLTGQFVEVDVETVRSIRYVAP
jgi:hypothetical protein